MTMNKKVTGIIFAALTVVFISGTVLLPTTMVFAAEEAKQEQPAPPQDAPKDGGTEHSGHHM